MGWYVSVSPAGEARTIFGLGDDDLLIRQKEQLSSFSGSVLFLRSCDTML